MSTQADVAALGAIQPYGLVLIAELATGTVVGGAGDIEERLTPAWLGRPIDKLLAQDVSVAIETASREGDSTVPLAIVPGRREAFDASLMISGGFILVELEPRSAHAISAAWVLAQLDALRASFAGARDLPALCDRAAVGFRALTGFDRVILYRILEDGSGAVVAEDRDPDREPGLPSLLGRSFPASDVPQRVRDLSLRNRVRSIPDTGYVPAPAQWQGRMPKRIDLGASGLRSVAAEHVEYLKAMGVAASTSITIVRDGALWGVVACHNATPKALDFDRRAVCRAFADELAREIGAKHDAEIAREQVRLRAAEHALIARFDQDAPFARFFTDRAEDIRAFLGADGFAAVQGDIVVRTPGCPAHDDLVVLARWARVRAAIEPFATDALAGHFSPAEAYRGRACGLLAVSLTTLTSTLMMWFRAEEPLSGDGEPSGRARWWTVGEIAAATRLRRSLFGMRQSYRVRELNRTLDAVVAERDQLRDALDRRVASSLGFVRTLLEVQSGGEDAVARRIDTVALVQTPLAQGERGRAIDLAAYLDDLIGAMRAGLSQVAQGALTLDLAPVPITADRAATVGLILAELIGNAYRHAYGQQPGPIAIDLARGRGRFRLSVTDQGGGTFTGAPGFGMRMMDSLAARLGGTIAYQPGRTGLQVVLSAPVDRDG